ncbi:MAG: TonB-dependent receptor SusC [Flavobacteriaceae bacterium]|nr:MAG: TonB-dependent receptor SusC [Flavobacteriaceae bacterium]
MKNNFRFSLILFMLTIFIGSMYAQTVNGTVSSDDGPLPGATVLVKGSTTGVSTDFDGNFAIEAGPDDVLVVSFIGFSTQDVAVGDQDQIMVMLESDNELDEVIVTSYGVQTRGSVTGSVAVVDMDDAVKTPVVNAAESLQGRASGVQVITNANPGQAPKINIRGFGSSNSTNPLFIIDGVQTEDPLILNNINPADIDQMNVLKDGAAAIYGARAANGVVIVTTKNGGYNSEKANVTFDFYTGVQQISNSPTLLNAQQHAQMIWDSYRNDGVTPAHGQYGSGASPVVPSQVVGINRFTSANPLIYPPVGTFTATVLPGGTDWIDTVSQDAAITNASFSISNGNENSKYLFSLGYLNREGIMRFSGFKRGNMRLNSEAKIGDKLTVGQHMNISFSDTRPGVDEAIEGAIRITPLLPAYFDDGAFAGTNGADLGNTRNPLAQLKRSENDFFKRLNFVGDIYASYELIDGLTLKTNIAGGLNFFNARQFTSVTPEHSEIVTKNTLIEQSQNGYNWNWTNTVNYVGSFGNHNINALLGMEAVKNGGKGHGVQRSEYLYETPEFYLLSNASGDPSIDYAYDGFNSLLSYFANVNYNFDDKYFFTATIRQDETSRFQEFKSDIFPSFSAGWNLSNEDFFPTSGLVNYMKIRASWGQLGNQSLPVNNPTLSVATFSESIANYSFDDSNIQRGLLLSQVGNTGLKWETSESTNFGIDLAFLNSKLSVSAEYFQIKTKDLITRDNSLISTTAIDSQAPFVNLGDIQNTGFDLSLGYGDQTANGFTYDVSFNLSHYKNEVTRLVNDTPIFGRGDIRNGSVTRTAVGGEISAFYGREYTGLDSNGRMIFAPDEDGDGDDRKVIGSPHPDFTYGININLGYNGFDLAAFFNGSQGNDVYNYTKVFSDFGYFFNGNRNARVLDAWTPSNTNTTVPALSASYPLEETSSNTYFLEDGSFLRLKNLQIGYTLPESVTERIGTDSVRIYLQGTNLFTITSYEGYDPEVVAYDNLSLGIDYRVYPFSRTLSLGTNIKF